MELNCVLHEANVTHIFDSAPSLSEIGPVWFTKAYEAKRENTILGFEESTSEMYAYKVKQYTNGHALITADKHNHMLRV